MENRVSAWQEHIDASISSTVNVPNQFTVEETEKSVTAGDGLKRREIILVTDDVVGKKHI